MKGMDFRIKLIEIRRAKGLTQEEVAESCHLNVRTIQRIESGQVQPRAHTIKLISDALDIDFFSKPEIQSRPFFWQIKDLFNFKTHKMKKVTILSSSALVLFLAAFMISGQMQAQLRKPAPKDGLTTSYNKDNTIKRIDAVFTNKLTLDSLTKISKDLAEYGINVSYRSMSFDKGGFLTSIECEVRKEGSDTGGSFTVKDLNTTNKDHHFGFYYNYSEEAENRFCAGACW